MREPQILDRRKFTLRVVYDAEDSWSIDQHSTPDIVGEPANDPTEIVGQNANNEAEIVGHEISESRRNLPKTASHYISLKEELDFVETSELNSAKRRDLRFDDFAGDGFSNHSGSPVGTVEGAWQGDQEPRSVNNGAHLARLERHLRDCPNGLDQENWERWVNYLERVIEEEEGETNAAWAQRLLDVLDVQELADEGLPPVATHVAVGNEWAERLPPETDSHNPECTASGTVEDGLGRGEPDAAHCALKAELDEFERLFGRAPADLDLDAWSARLGNMGADETVPSALRFRARHLLAEIGHRQARLFVAAKAAKRQKLPSDEHVDAGMREKLHDLIAAQGSDMVSTIARLTKLTEQKVQNFCAGEPGTPKMRVGLSLALQKISAGNGAG
ncbi:hypothetical protein Sphch_3156 [Sphingobium chlorophenolicum L-1]|uniref:Uncharacterized protein n=2 Tax=Sphingobium chlorophenolicum TaxID=46429 RepID=F6F2V9_SPHCR|nr:hypothetical protein Sphch_3156 [Sphingobium chlorophenolicum L-1]